MNEKFKNVPTDDETTILFESTMKFGDLDILYQKWHWDNIYAQSIVFVEEDIKTMTDDELKEYVKESDIIKDKNKITMSRDKDGFTFINFNFQTEE